MSDSLFAAMSDVLLAILRGDAPDGRYEDDCFVYSIKDGKVEMIGKPLKDVFIYGEQFAGTV
jgi:hypothetical protein